MSELKVGDPAPQFSMPGSGDQSLSLDPASARFLVLYFYPKDDTPGCTKEAISFTEHKDTFDALGADIIGVSKDTVAKHEKFIAKHDLGITLGADTEGTVVEDYGVWVEKNMYGKRYMGIERATFLIGPDQTIVAIWRKVRVKNHVETVLETLKSHIGA